MNLTKSVSGDEASSADSSSTSRPAYHKRQHGNSGQRELEALNQSHVNTFQASLNHTDVLHVVHRPLSPMHAHCHLGLTGNVSGCMTAHAKFLYAAELNILQFLEHEDSNELVRHISIKFINSDALNVNKAFDSFVTPRPWWVIKEEPYAWQSGLVLHDEKPHLDTHGQLKSHNLEVTYATLSRIKHELECRMKHLAGVQFPPEEVCRSVPLAVGRLIDNGWASMMALYGYARRRYTISSPYISKTNSPYEDTIFSPGGSCDTEKNKWLCAFLPTTNCSIPLAIVDCSNEGCMERALGKDCAGAVWFDHAHNASKPMQPKPAEKLLDSFNNAQNSYHRQLDSNYKAYDRFNLKKAVQYDVNNVPRERAPDTYWVTYLYGLLWRHGYRFRSEIAKILEEVRGNDSFAFTPGFQCTAVHIRRGDRSLEGVDMVAYCKGHVRNVKPDGTPDNNNCSEVASGKWVSCTSLSDLGCFSTIPFGALTLNNYLDKAWVLQKSHNIFLMTDATPTWLEQQRANISSSWKIFSLPAVDRQKPQQGLNFFASVAIARKCGALVGNWFSGVSMLVHESMCYAHSNKLGECPPTYDMGNTHPGWILSEPSPVS